MDIHIVIQNLLSFVPMYISCLKLKVIDRDVEKFTVNTKAPNFFFFTVSICGCEYSITQYMKEKKYTKHVV